MSKQGARVMSGVTSVRPAVVAAGHGRCGFIPRAITAWCRRSGMPNQRRGNMGSRGAGDRGDRRCRAAGGGRAIRVEDSKKKAERWAFGLVSNGV